MKHKLPGYRPNMQNTQTGPRSDSGARLGLSFVTILSDIQPGEVSHLDRLVSPTPGCNAFAPGSIYKL